MQSNCLFARKFDENKDKFIIDKIYNTLSECDMKNKFYRE
jgi:hypothetical protein